ncbi:hypothetical protein FCH28_17235 [Streptomyces piniterrae]|uniref:Uncharacterized protein n=1 Tax=Streptomyces piniterrae TaxID=2571125 RepID=A0A4U0NFL0_9ACTN|nr:hypothetical protein [Streptomyces piniterrae]TJZ52915.1 hypothetical protein FCH28_17235 [Streptomyces piniterrae]
MSSVNEHQWTDPVEAAESLRTALSSVGIVLPSLAADAASPELRLVDLGRVRAEVAVELADAIRRDGDRSNR